MTDTKVSEQKSATLVEKTSLQCHEKDDVMKGIPIREEHKHQNDLEYYQKADVVI